MPLAMSKVLLCPSSTICRALSRKERPAKMRCRKCRTELPDNSRYCLVCGVDQIEDLRKITDAL